MKPLMGISHFWLVGTWFVPVVQVCSVYMYDTCHDIIYITLEVLSSTHGSHDCIKPVTEKQSKVQHLQPTNYPL
jgi:hypothetical protein